MDILSSFWVMQVQYKKGDLTFIFALYLLLHFKSFLKDLIKLWLVNFSNKRYISKDFREFSCFVFCKGRKIIISIFFMFCRETSDKKLNIIPRKKQWGFSILKNYIQATSFIYDFFIEGPIKYKDVLIGNATNMVMIFSVFYIYDEI